MYSMLEWNRIYWKNWVYVETFTKKKRVALAYMQMMLIFNNNIENIDNDHILF